MNIDITSKNLYNLINTDDKIWKTLIFNFHSFINQYLETIKLPVLKTSTYSDRKKWN